MHENGKCYISLSETYVPHVYSVLKERPRNDDAFHDGFTVHVINERMFYSFIDHGYTTSVRKCD